MSFAEMFPGETSAALADRAANPVPLPAPKRSTWAELGDFLSAPFTGSAQGVNESLRVFNRLSSFGSARRNESAARTSETMRRAEAAAVADIDEGLRSNADFWKLDPMTAGWATNFLHDAGRVVTKFAGYSLLGGAPAAVVGTGIDEGSTSFMSLRDQGVDSVTAAKVGGVHGAVTAVTAGIAPVASTPLRSAILVGISGPGAFMAESALSREILQSANYPQLAATFDPFDSLGLTLSLVPGAAVAASVHTARARAAGRAEPPASPPRVEPLPEIVDAAHVQLQRDLVEAGNLGRVDDPTAGIAHVKALDEARAALEQGRSIELPLRVADDARAAPVMAHIDEQLRAADVPRLADEARADEPLLGAEPMPVTEAERMAAPAVAGADASQARAPLQRALDVARERPDLPVRLEDDGSPTTPASDLVRTEAQRASQEAREAITATQAAIECFLKFGVN